MEILSKKNKHFDVDIKLNEAEIQSLIGVFEQNCMLYNRPTTELGGLRQELYDKFKSFLTPQ